MAREMGENFFFLFSGSHKNSCLVTVVGDVPVDSLAILNTEKPSALPQHPSPQQVPVSSRSLQFGPN